MTILPSHDLEDAISVVDGRMDIVEEIKSSPDSIKQFLSEQFKYLLKDRKFEEALPGYLPPDSAGQGRFDLLMDKLNKVSKL